MFNVPLYFMTNLRRSASAFFVYLVFMIVTVLTMSMFFRTVASLCKTIEQSMIPSSMIILIFSAYTGYIIPVKDMVPWLAWLRRLNPIAFCYESLMINEVCPKDSTSRSFADCSSSRIAYFHVHALSHPEGVIAKMIRVARSAQLLEQGLVKSTSMAPFSLQGSIVIMRITCGGKLSHP